MEEKEKEKEHANKEFFTNYHKTYKKYDLEKMRKFQIKKTTKELKKDEEDVEIIEINVKYIFIKKKKVKFNNTFVLKKIKYFWCFFF